MAFNGTVSRRYAGTGGAVCGLRWRTTDNLWTYARFSARRQTRDVHFPVSLSVLLQLAISPLPSRRASRAHCQEIEGRTNSGLCNICSLPTFSPPYRIASCLQHSAAMPVMAWRTARVAVRNSSENLGGHCITVQKQDRSGLTFTSAVPRKKNKPGRGGAAAFRTFPWNIDVPYSILIILPIVNILPLFSYHV